MEHFNIYDIDFWDSDPEKFIYCGHAGIFDPHTFVLRFDESTSNFFPGWIGSVNKIKLSTNNDSLITLGCWANFAGVYIRISESTDGGYSWNTISDSLEFLAQKPDNDQVLFCFNDNGYISNYNGCLYKSSNGGVNFYLVDTLKKYPSAENDEIMFDVNANNILRLFETTYGAFVLRTSLNSGEPFSWQTKYSSDSKIFISLDESVWGTIYLADKKNIFVSTDFGNNFSLYKTLERKIVGIYKKPNSNKLYAATKYKIYEITPDTIQVVKSLPIPQEVLNYYPLAIGNKWIYNEYQWGQLANLLIKEIVTDTMLPNGKGYYALSEYFYGGGGPVLSYERIDSINGKVYRYDEWPGIPDSEYVIDDLLAEVGDTAYSYRLSLPDDGFTMVIGETTFDKWGINKGKKVLKEYIWNEPVYSLVRDIGLDSIYYHDAYGDYYTTLKGCIIDGIVYGDTATVGVEDEQPLLATEFILEQNYPNPFNPRTSIQYAIGSRQFVMLKVYDVLGNEVATLVNEEKPAGEYEFEFNVDQVSRPEISSGVYFYQLKVGSFIQTKKMVYFK